MNKRRTCVELAAGIAIFLVGCSSPDQATGSGSNGTGGGSQASAGSGMSAGPGGEGGAGPVHAHGPVKGLVKVGTAEYSTGLLMDDGKILMETGQTMPVLSPLGVPAGVSLTDYAGGLHQSVAIDSTGHVWTWGDTNIGLQGSGMDGGDPTIPYKILVDANGDDFSGIVGVAAGYQYNGAVKNDGTVWVWGKCDKGISGNGMMSDVLSKPTKVPLPAGVKIKKFVFSTIALALAEDGAVWSWGADGAYGINDILGRNTMSGLTPGKVENLPANIADIASGGGFSYALTTDGQLFGWGIANKLGDEKNFTQPPANMEKYFHLPKPVKFVAANDHTTHVILTDGSLWGWGDAAEGEVGDGQEIDFGTVGPHSDGKYTWDWGQNELPVYKPVRIAPEISNFKAVYTNTAYVFYVFAVTEDGYLYSWGRNKTGDLMNGIVGAAPLAGNISATFPNSWDVPTATNVNPLELMKNTQVTSPYCLTHQDEKPCDQFNNMTGKAYYE